MWWLVEQLGYAGVWGNERVDLLVLRELVVRIIIRGKGYVLKTIYVLMLVKST